MDAIAAAQVLSEIGYLLRQDPDQKFRAQAFSAAAWSIAISRPDLEALHKTNELRGYHILATDGEIGHVNDFLIDDGGRTVQYLVVDTSNWIGGKSA